MSVCKNNKTEMRDKYPKTNLCFNELLQCKEIESIILEVIQFVVHAFIHK